MRGQVSLEFLMVTGLAMLILTGATFFMFQYTKTSSEKNAISQTATLGYQIVDQARNMFFYGSGSFTTVETSLPPQVKEVYVVENSTLIFDINTGTRGVVSVPIFADVPINGTVLVGNKVHVNGSGLVVHQGRTSYRIESQGGWVQISQTT